ncbi:secretogranin-1 [Syngnathoides biaculeatus]|uniref:secretogranin-1 n=1 Tax=Syngnathoides biaculeatus TaxID=300417 RepID=UPI002ADDE765|nr:secretogranin-1 [Syngnathoides biaculeatus]
MTPPLFLLLGLALLAGNQALPLGKEGQREDVVTRCLVEVLSKALSQPDTQMDKECKEILRAGIKHAPPDKKSNDVTDEEPVKDHEKPEAEGLGAQDIQELLKSVEPNQETLKDEHNQESWSLEKRHQENHGQEEEQEREKRSNWRPGRFHQKNHKRDEESLGGESKEDGGEERSQESWADDERSQESWGLNDDRDKRKWRVGRYHQRRHKRDEELSEDPDEERKDPDEERSQESWDFDIDRYKRHWRPGRYHQRRHKRDEELSEEAREEPDDERSQESWDLDDERDKRKWRAGRYHQRRHKRDEELSEDPDEERSQESWDFDTGRYKRDWRPGRFHQRRHKRDEELSEDPDEERSQESWDFDIDRYKRHWRPGRYHQRRHKRDEELSEDPDEERSQEYWDFDTDRYKREWRPGRYHQRRQKRDEELPEEAREEQDEDRSQESWNFDIGREKKTWKPGRYLQEKSKRDEELSEEKREESDGDRSQEYWSFDKRHNNDDIDFEKRIWKQSHPQNHQIYRKPGGEELSEDEDLRDDSDNLEGRNEALRYLTDKRNPWIYRGYYHPAWFKRDPEDHAAPNKMDEAAKLLSQKIDQLAHREAAEGAMHPRGLTPHEEKALENLAAMDAEMKNIAAKLQDKE